MRNHPRLVGLLMLLAGSWFFQTDLVSAQTPSGMIAGVVKDQTGAVIAGVTVSITNPENSSVHLAQTNEYGRFDFPKLLPGTYRITVNVNDFPAWTMEKTVVVGETGQLEVIFQPASQAGPCGCRPDVPVPVKDFPFELTALLAGAFSSPRPVMHIYAWLPKKQPRHPEPNPEPGLTPYRDNVRLKKTW